MTITVIVSLAVGAVAAWILTLLTRDQNFFLRNVLAGMLGGLVGGVLISLLNIASGSWIVELVVSAVCAVAALIVVKLLLH